jgi:hypothetical protein
MGPDKVPFQDEELLQSIAELGEERIDLLLKIATLKTQQETVENKMTPLVVEARQRGITLKVLADTIGNITPQTVFNKWPLEKT